MIEAIAAAAANFLVPYNVLYLVLGVLAGIVIGALPGLGGVTGLAILLPFILEFRIPPIGAIIMLMSVTAVVMTSDSIPAILFGVPGSAGAQATCLDGFAMAKNGEPGRALGAAFTSSVIGGVSAAVVLMFTIPLMRPLILKIGSPQLFMISLLGITLIGTLSGRNPFVGVALGLFGVLISMIGQDPQTGYYRWTFDELYLLDGLPLIPSVLGLFALTELIDVLGKGKTSVAPGNSENIARDIFKGMRDALQNIPLIIKCAGIGLYVGAIPGLGGSVADWMAYGFAKQSVKDSSRWGEGDVRAVIAPDAATNAKSSGALMTTVSFGIPGDAPSIIIMSGLLALGITPGPKMFVDHLNVTTTMVWTLVFANILGAAILIFGIRIFAKLAYANLTTLAPFLVGLVFLSAYLCTSHIGDIITLLIFTVIGVILKKTGLPRPPLVLGLILGPIIARYLFITVSLYGAEWVKLPSVIVLAFVIVLIIFKASWKLKKRQLTAHKEA